MQNKFTTFKNKLLLPIQITPKNINKIQAFQHNIILHKITNVPLFISNLTHKDIVIKTIIVFEVHTVYIFCHCQEILAVDFKKKV
ncbi:putative RNA-directed DNA polymerase [Aphis craccivora]|uniref:Putative RNA-directed DNA polymerase n=1 Tax=Aphis craccivora TaxID=307492 RepID=A0A6G0ZCW2_APHCR|nr:putative RNA-directed DNA polymerase [Aphis craccivora]